MDQNIGVTTTGNTTIIQAWSQQVLYYNIKVFKLILQYIEVTGAYR